MDPKVILICRTKKMPGGVTTKYFNFRWSEKTGFKYRSLGRCESVDLPNDAIARKQKKKELCDAFAEQLEAERDAKLETEKLAAEENSGTRIKLSAFIKYHETKLKPNCRPTTVIEWSTACNHAIKAIGDKLLNDIEWTDAGEIRAYLEGKGRSKATVRKTLSMLRAMFARATKKKLIAENPFADEELGEKISRPKRIFSNCELDGMVEAADNWWKLAITLAYTSGLRRAELLHLRWVDFDSVGSVRVEEHRKGRYTTDEHDLPILAWKPKTKKSTRTVAIPAETVLMLMRMQKLGDGSPYIFISIKRLLAIDAKAKAGKLRANFDIINNFTREFNDIQDAAKKKLEIKNWPHGCWHDLRKTFATICATNGVPMHELQAALGHSSITTTAEYYTEVEKSAADRQRAVFTKVA
ncbi:MAG: site-specific integrase [Planctomycetes bacterium]|nr:site-specific integrase [Planctomycetota bacterium]